MENSAAGLPEKNLFRQTGFYLSIVQLIARVSLSVDLFST
jgi:hypothetical protein